ncbi:MAG TPA: pantothenate kinase [Bacteroidales bacterium]|nr:MAG: hypothetical protein A2W98_12260 [Bacteroidetes bacterium GWF2_33_38]OFY73051.1 MAG: hypothetical protein A2265_10505 [Bacteroidetes bacterium RIFOXYA12_FULL_33_9]OFY89830.1 MAG: hypothetical protein A2236_02445 [Bacteroidetes bacterium RIFOXYA2_FULL_33_7]HBF88379.1 pantothenate kinase [Bacteroidales bacterium]
MQLVVDVGNSYTKIYIFNETELICSFRFENSNVNVKDVFKQYPLLDKAIVSTVANSAIIHELKSKLNHVIEFNYKLKLPINIEYKTPDTLGKDRIAGVIGAKTIFENTNVLVVDLGTAITFDFLDNNGVYKGGNISLGLNTRFKALHTFTDKLPLLKPENNFELIANTTNSAIISGVQQGIIFEIEGYIQHLQKEYNDLKIILTGGDCFFFEKKLKNTIFVEPNLIAYGLNRILETNV